MKNRYVLHSSWYKHKINSYPDLILSVSNRYTYFFRLYEKFKDHKFPLKTIKKWIMYVPWMINNRVTDKITLRLSKVPY